MLPPNIELRKDAAGNIDDIVVDQPTMFRMEYMDNGQWWLKVYTLKGDLVIRCKVEGWPSFELE